MMPGHPSRRRRCHPADAPPGLNPGMPARAMYPRAADAAGMRRRAIAPPMRIRAYRHRAARI
jgi:hypothetical protein